MANRELLSRCLGVLRDIWSYFNFTLHFSSISIPETFNFLPNKLYEVTQVEDTNYWNLVGILIQSVDFADFLLNIDSFNK